MPTHSQIILFALIFNSCCFLGSCKVWVKTLENCSLKMNCKARINVTLKTVDDRQYADGSWVSAAPLDNHLKANVSVDTLVGNQWVYLISITERKPCDALNKYFGEFLYDLERNAQMIPGMCPIPKGRYHVHHYLLDFDKMTTLANFPFGNLRLTYILKEGNGSIFCCMVAEVNNQINQ